MARIYRVPYLFPEGARLGATAPAAPNAAEDESRAVAENGEALAGERGRNLGRDRKGTLDGGGRRGRRRRGSSYDSVDH